MFLSVCTQDGGITDIVTALFQWMASSMAWSFFGFSNMLLDILIAIIITDAQ